MTYSTTGWAGLPPHQTTANTCVSVVAQLRWPDGEDDGQAGVREPRRPLGPDPTLEVSRELPR